MDGLMEYNFASIGELGSSVDTRVSTINGLLEDLRSRVNSLTEMYAGAASEGFRATQNQWNQSADSLNATLARIATAVHTTNADAQATEAKNAGRW
jgi:6 kDa early secretory antigenic target